MCSKKKRWQKTHVVHDSSFELFIRDKDNFGFSKACHSANEIVCQSKRKPYSFSVTFLQWTAANFDLLGLHVHIMDAKLQI